MNYEEAYKEAIERCKSWMRCEHPECFTEAQKAGEYIFPELRESEDEKIRKAIKEAVKNYWSDDTQALTDILAWLEKQGEQNPTIIEESSWSEEDEERLNSIIEVLGNNSILVQWLKSLKDRVQPQPKQEWSEGIKSRLDEISDFLQYKGREDDAEFIKSLKPNHWKPSEFQLKCLKKVIPHNNTEKDCELEYVLTELYEDLKKL